LCVARRQRISIELNTVNIGCSAADIEQERVVIGQEMEWETPIQKILKNSRLITAVMTLGNASMGPR
jgi:hypothetical protein